MAPLKVFCQQAVSCGRQVEWHGACPEGHGITWSERRPSCGLAPCCHLLPGLLPLTSATAARAPAAKVCCSWCHACIKPDKFNPKKWSCPACKHELHGGIVKYGGVTVH
jgi:hypothetical protein